MLCLITWKTELCLKNETKKVLIFPTDDVTDILILIMFYIDLKIFNLGKFLLYQKTVRDVVHLTDNYNFNICGVTALSSKIGFSSITSVIL